MKAWWCGRYPNDLLKMDNVSSASLPSAFATRVEVVSTLRSMFENVDVELKADLTRDLHAPRKIGTDDVEWLMISDWDFLIVVHLSGVQEWCNLIVLIVWEGDDKAQEVVRRVLERFQLRAWDRSTGDFLSTHGASGNDSL
jgi:hypothetical protein